MITQQTFHQRFKLFSEWNRTHARVIAVCVALLIVFMAAAVRWHMVGVQSLWNDEGNAYVQATRDVVSIAQNAASDIHPPGYYWLLRIWRAFTGESELALRSLSVFASVITVALTYALGVRLYGRGAGLVAGLALALNTFSIYYAQEARMYALLAMWGAGAMWLFVLFIHARTRRQRWRWGLLMACFNLAGLWTQYVYPSVMLVQGVMFVAWWVAQWRTLTPAHLQGLLRLLGVYTVVNTLTLALYAPWFPTAWGQITTWPNTGVPVPFGEALGEIINWMTLGITHETTTFGVPVLFLLLFGLLNRPQGGGWRAIWKMLLPVMWVALTLGMFLALEMFRPANLKLLLPAQVGFVLWMGRGVWVLWTLNVRRTASPLQVMPRIAAGGAVVVLALSLASGLTPLYHAEEYQRDDYRGLVATIRADRNDASAVILNAPGQSEVFFYYADMIPHVYMLPIGMTVDQSATQDVMQNILEQYERVYAVLWGTDERDPDGLVEGRLDREAFQVDSRWFGSVRLVRYFTPRTLIVEQERNTRFGDSITLQGVRLSGLRALAGEPILVQLRWTTGALLDTRYKVFVQLLNDDGVLVAQRDSEPVGSTFPTLAWTPNMDVIDNHAVLIPPDAPAGRYTLIVGLYDANDAFARLPVGGETYHMLAQITVTR